MAAGKAERGSAPEPHRQRIFLPVAGRGKLVAGKGNPFRQTLLALAMTGWAHPGICGSQTHRGSQLVQVVPGTVDVGLGRAWNGGAGASPPSVRGRDGSSWNSGQWGKVGDPQSKAAFPGWTRLPPE